MSVPDDELTTTLNRELHARADSLDGRLSLTDVQGRARGIRRRRTTGAVLGAALAVAVLVPTAVAAGWTAPHHGALQPASRNVSPRPTPDRGPQTFTVDIHPGSDGLVLDQLGVASWSQGRLTAPTGRSIAVAREVLDPVAAADGTWSGVAFHQGSYTWTSWDASGQVTDSHPASSGNLAVTPDGTATAYAADLAAPGASPDWRIVLTGPHARTWPLSTTPQNGAGAVGILSDGTVVFATDPGAVRLAHPDGSITALPGRELGAVAASAATDRIVVQTSSNRDGTSCWAIEDATGSRSAQTCTYALGALSADGKYVIGSASEADNGLRTVHILDVDTLAPVATFEARGNGAFASQMVWDGDTVLASYTQHGRWYVEHLGLGGIAQQGGPGIASDPYGPPPYSFSPGPPAP